MNSRAFTLSLIVAGIAMFMIYSYLEGQEGLYIEKYGKERSIAVAKQDIDELELLDETKVEMKNVPMAFIAPGAIGSKEKLQGVYAAVPIRKGEQVTVSRLTYPGASMGLSRQVSMGKRAFAINVNDEQGVSKLIRPGDRVDVLAAVDYAGGRPDLLKVKTILQDVLIISTGLSIANNIPLVTMKGTDGDRQVKLNSYTQYNTVALEVDPFQVQKLIFILQRGARIYLSLRNNDDKSTKSISTTTIYDLLSEERQEVESFFNAVRGAGGN